MNHNSLSARVSQALNSKSTSIQGHTLSTMINEIQDFVEEYNEEYRLAKDIDSVRRNESELRSKVRANPDDGDLKREHQEIEELLRQAQQLESQLRGKMQVIGHLKRDVQNLGRELSKAQT